MNRRHFLMTSIASFFAGLWPWQKNHGVRGLNCVFQRFERVSNRLPENHICFALKHTFMLIPTGMEIALVSPSTSRQT